MNPIKQERGYKVMENLNLIIDGYAYAGSLDLPTLLGAKGASNDVLKKLLESHPCYFEGTRVTIENLMGKFKTALL